MFYSYFDNGKEFRAEIANLKSSISGIEIFHN